MSIADIVTESGHNVFLDLIKDFPTIDFSEPLFEFPLPLDSCSIEYTPNTLPFTNSFFIAQLLDGHPWTEEEVGHWDSVNAKILNLQPHDNSEAELTKEGNDQANLGFEAILTI